MVADLISGPEPEPQPGILDRFSVTSSGRHGAVLGITEVSMVIEREQAELIVEEPILPTCCHHWIIEPANGRVSWGKCQICHEIKEFQNSISDMDRE